MKRIAFHNYHQVLNNNNYMFNNENTLIGDNLMRPFLELRKYATTKSIEVGTVEEFDLNSVDAFVFIDMPAVDNKYFKAAVASKKPMYLIVLESQLIIPDNFDKKNHVFFEKVFTYTDSLIDNKKYFKINYAHIFPQNVSQNISKKEKLCTIIAGNKKSSHPLELYSKRVEAIHWFEKNHPAEFDLYGMKWDEMRLFGFKIGRIARHLNFLHGMLQPEFPLYKGTVERKRTVLEKYKFSICYENARDLNGYITEKIFDCFFAGCVPVYWGADNITEHIPANCFIDKRNYQSYDKLYKYIANMPDSEYIDYVNNIESFLQSEKAYPFTCDYFAKTVVENINI